MERKRRKKKNEDERMTKDQGINISTVDTNKIFTDG